MTDLWTHLNALDTDSFLSFARLHLGTVEMPYNKQRLAERLVSFFSDESVKANTMASVRADEADLLSLVSVFGPLDEGQLASLLPEGRRKSALRSIHLLLNRALLLYDGARKLDLNSTFDYSGVLNKSVFDGHLKSGKRTIRLRESLKAIASLVNTAQPKRVSTFAHRNAGHLAPSFPLLEEEELECLMQAFIDTSLALGVMVMEDGVCTLRKAESLAFFALPLADIQVQLLSGGKSTEGAALLALYAALFDREMTRRAFQTLYRGTDRDALLSSYSRLAFIFDEIEEEEMDSAVTVTGDMQLRYASSPADSLFFLYTNPVLIDSRLVTLSLDLESVRAGFRQGLSGDEMIAELYGDGPVDENVRFRITDWMERYAAFTICEGIYLETNERNAALIEKMPLLQIHIIRRIGKTGFLMKKKSEEQWRRLLFYIGFDMLPATEREAAVGESKAEGSLSITWPASPDLSTLPPAFRAQDDAYRAALIEKAESLPEGERQACIELIESGQIVKESQMVSGESHRVGLVVSGFDHQAKIRLLAKGSGKADALFEITSPQGTALYTVDSIQSEKSANAAVTLTDRDGTTIVMPVSRIFKIRELLV